MKKLKLINSIVFLMMQIALYSQELDSMNLEFRETFIQKALGYRSDEKFELAIQQLDSLLNRNPNDSAALLFKGDLALQDKNYKLAVNTYKRLMLLNYEPTITQINLSYALFLSHKPKKALRLAENAWKGDKLNSNAIINYFNALLWNLRTSEALFFLNENSKYLDPSQIMVMQARLHTVSGDYNKGILSYNQLVNKYHNKYFVLEYAEFLINKKEFIEAENVIKKDSSLFSSNEYKSILNKLFAPQISNVGSESNYFIDIAENVRIENFVYWMQKEGRSLKFGIAAGASSVSSKDIDKTTNVYLNTTCQERWGLSWTGESSVKVGLISPKLKISFLTMTGRQSFQFKPNDRVMLGLNFNTEILNYTASLFEKNIRMSNAGYTTHLMIDGMNGFYSQGSVGLLSDNNMRYLFFGSVYHLIRTEPTLKCGLNFTALHFRDNEIKDYFSPSRCLNTELFTDFSTAMPQLSKFYLQFQAAVGVQKIENRNWDPSYRAQIEMGLHLKKFHSTLKYQFNNLSSSNGAGYSYNWFTLKFIWNL